MVRLPDNRRHDGLLRVGLPFRYQAERFLDIRVWGLGFRALGL